MPITRRFIDWSLPSLGAAVDYLLTTYAASRSLDLSGVLVVLPGSRAARRLLEILVERADERSLILTPPRILTGGELPEQLYVAGRPWAGELAQQMAWIEAPLRQFGPERLSKLTARPPDADDLPGMLAIAGTLAELHRELAADMLGFADVIARAEGLETFDEADRWRLLADIQDRYLRVLDKQELWDEQTARLVAIRQNECQASGDIVLVGTVDMGRTQRAMLDQVADRVTALVFAPEVLADRFDEHGCVRASAWQRVTLPLDESIVDTVDLPSDQAEAVARAIARVAGRHSADEISVGVTDERLVPYVLARLEECGVPARYGVGEPIASSGPYRLLEAAADYLADRSFASLAALVRHPAMSAYLSAGGIRFDAAAACDNYFSDRLPVHAAHEGSAGDEHSRRFAQLSAAVEKLFSSWPDGPRLLVDWAPLATELLCAVYGVAPIDARTEHGRKTLAACDAIEAGLGELGSLPRSLAPAATAAQGLQLALERAAGQTIPPRGGEPAVELLGWLELPLDDAPCLVVAGLNEGLAPKSVNADPFLPDQLRRKLQLVDNERRYARDAYATCVLSSSGRLARVVAGRRTAAGDPLWPSRLLLACDCEQLPRRVLATFGPAQQSVRRSRKSTTCDHSAIINAPPPRPLAEPVTSMRVTEFRDYLACPYRYYLRHRLRLSSIADAGQELDAAQFGNLLHDALRRSGWEEWSQTTREEEVARLLSIALDAVALEAFGGATLPAVRLQIEQARWRLENFARWQAGWRAKGWRIEFVECDISAESGLVVDGEPMGLRGRIDRIDIHDATGERCVFDYKTGDNPSKPEAAHRKQGNWIDLQLPLYRHLLTPLGIGGPVSLGYLVLPRSGRRVDCRLDAAWSDDDLLSADLAAYDVVRRVRREEFWPPATTPPAFSEDFAAICRQDVLASAAAAYDPDAEAGES